MTDATSATKTTSLIGLFRFKGFGENLSYAAPLIGLAGIYLYARSTPHTWLVFGVLALLALATCVSGAVLGFLFGVPRLRTGSSASPGSAADSSAFVPNTNLEQISDWLTKIIVGATLVQLRPLVDGFASATAAIGAQLGVAGAAIASGAIMVLFFSGGFLWGYLWCSLKVFVEMSALVDRERAVAVREASPPRLQPEN
jgi:hypothetical protein